MTITTLVPWFGSNRMLAQTYGEALDGCEWVGIPFAGGMAEIKRIKARTIVANDLHRHVINLARIVSSESTNEVLKSMLRKQLFHPDTLYVAQSFCDNFSSRVEGGILDHACKLDDDGNKISIAWAVSYFICCWMGRSSKAGTKSEFKGKPAIRWEAGGGDSAKRYHSAIDSLDEWCKEFQRCTFTCLDVDEFLNHCKDREGHGIYLDPPFFDSGDAYEHVMSMEQHRVLAFRLTTYQKARIVLRFYDHEMVCALYPSGEWDWVDVQGGRKQTNEKVGEVMLCRNVK